MVCNEAAILRSVRWISGQGLPTRGSRVARCALRRKMSLSAATRWLAAVRI